MKKSTAIFLAAMLALSLVACGQKTPTSPVASSVAEPSAVTAAESAQKEDTASVESAREEGTASAESAQEAAPALPDGIYSAEFVTDNSMFRVNETSDGKGILFVQDGEMTLHIVLRSKNIVNLYPGLAENAQKEGAVLLEPTAAFVVYPDGTEDEVNSFDVPVPYLDQEFDLALIGTKGVWYDHKVSVNNPQPLETEVADGEYTCEVQLEGGSGRATVESPAKLTVQDGKITATIVWSSPNYDYMLVNGEKYLPVNTEGNSTFEIPVEALDTALEVIGDTVAMSEPHEISYTLTFDSATLTPEA